MPEALMALLLFAAGLVAGISNSIAGGGTFFSFPAFLAAGLPPVVANASNAFAVWPANIVAAYTYRRELATLPVGIKASLVNALAGGALGASLLKLTGDDAFSRMIPFLILFATLLFAFGKRLRDLLFPLAAGGVTAHPGIAARVFEFVVAVYGGFFGAGMGVMLMAGLLMMGVDNVQQNNALKNLLSAVINSAAILVFIFSDLISWPQTLITFVGSIFGGLIGASVARKLPAVWLARIVIAVGVSLSVYYFFEYYGPVG